MLRASKILQHAISRMLDASRIEFGHEKLSCEEFDLNDVFDELRSEFVAPPALTIRWPQASGIAPLRTDDDKLRTIVRNLVENAFKYTPQGMVTVEARWDERRDEVEIRVADTGIGIPPAEIETIFEAFRQGSNRNLFGKAGVGLGLYIVQRLVQRLGGEIAVESQLDEGSTFTARIPRLLHRGDAVAADGARFGPCGVGAGGTGAQRRARCASGIERAGDRVGVVRRRSLDQRRVTHRPAGRALGDGARLGLHPVLIEGRVALAEIGRLELGVRLRFGLHAAERVLARHLELLSLTLDRRVDGKGGARRHQDRACHYPPLPLPPDHAMSLRSFHLAPDLAAPTHPHSERCATRRGSETRTVEERGAEGSRQIGNGGPNLHPPAMDGIVSAGAGRC